MSYKIEIIGNGLVVTVVETGSVIIDRPSKDMYYDPRTDANILLLLEKGVVGQAEQLIRLEIPVGEAVDSVGTPFTKETFATFCRVNLGFSSAGSSTALSTQIYRQSFMIDSANVLYWMSSNSSPTTFFTKEYNTVSGNVDKTGSAVTTTNIYVRTPLGFATGNQTVVSLDYWCNGQYMEDWDGITLLKVKFGTQFNDQVYITELYRGSVALKDGIGDTYLSRVTIPASSFTDTSITDGDVIFMQVSANGLLDILPCEVILKCSIN